MPPNTDPIKLRIRLPSGAEFEAEGPAELVLQEKNLFLGAPGPHQTTAPEPPGAAIAPAPWQNLAEKTGGLIYIKQKSPDITAQEAALIIVAIAKMAYRMDSLPALQLSQSLKKSGYFQGRLDRIVLNEVKNACLDALGTKRNRTYAITQKGLARAFSLAQKLSGHKRGEETPG